MPIGDLHDFLHGIKENVGEIISKQTERFKLGKGDTKAQQLFSVKVAPQSISLSGKSRLHSLVAANPTIKRILDSAKAHFSSKEVKPKSADRHLLLDSFRTEVLNAKTSKQNMLAKTVSFLSLADNMGELDKGMYNTVARELQQSLSRSSIVLDGLEGFERTIHHELLEASNLSPRLKEKLQAFQNAPAQKNEAVDAATSKQLVDRAKGAALHEVTTEIGGKKYTTVSLPSGEVLLKQQKLGEGAGSIVFKAISLTNNREVVIKYATELAVDTGENENAQKILNHVGQHNGVQSPLELHTIETNEGPKQVAVDQYFKDRDPIQNITMQEFFKKIGLTQNDWDNQQARGAKIKEFGQKFKQELMDTPQSERAAKVEAFSNEEAPILRALMGDARVDQLIAAYEGLCK